MSDTHLIAPHGGLSEPVNRMVADVETVLSNANGLTRVPVSDADLSSVYRFGDGGLSPLTGPMDAQTYHRVLDESVIEVNGKRYAWTIPISLPVSPDLAKTLSIGQKVALENTSGEIVAVLDISDIFEWDKTKYLKRVYLTDRTDHPGADMVLNGDGDKTHLLGGEIQVLPSPKTHILDNTSSAREKSGSSWPKKAGTALWHFKRAMPCIAHTNTHWYMAWKPSCARDTTQARA